MAGFDARESATELARGFQELAGRAEDLRQHHVRVQRASVQAKEAEEHIARRSKDWERKLAQAEEDLDRVTNLCQATDVVPHVTAVVFGALVYFISLMSGVRSALSFLFALLGGGVSMLETDGHQGEVFFLLPVVSLLLLHHFVSSIWGYLVYFASLVVVASKVSVVSVMLLALGAMWLRSPCDEPGAEPVSCDAPRAEPEGHQLGSNDATHCCREMEQRLS